MVSTIAENVVCTATEVLTPGHVLQERVENAEAEGDTGSARRSSCCSASENIFPAILSALDRNVRSIRSQSMPTFAPAATARPIRPSVCVMLKSNSRIRRGRPFVSSIGLPCSPIWNLKSCIEWTARAETLWTHNGNYMHVLLHKLLRTLHKRECVTRRYLRPGRKLRVQCLT